MSTGDSVLIHHTRPSRSIWGLVKEIMCVIYSASSTTFTHLLVGLVDQGARACFAYAIRYTSSLSGTTRIIARSTSATWRPSAQYEAMLEITPELLITQWPAIRTVRSGTHPSQIVSTVQTSKAGGTITTTVYQVTAKAELRAAVAWRAL